MKKKEIMIVFSIAIILGIFLIFNIFNKKDTNTVVVKNGNGEVVATYNLDEDGYYELQGNYGLFHLEIKDGRVCATDVDCPNQICVNTGWIDINNLNQIICVPNGLWVEIQ